jgi:hypothetical protein
MVKISEVEIPAVYKDRILFKEGVIYGGIVFTREMVETIYSNTEWKNENASIFEKHNKDREHKGIEERWVGRVDNLKLRDDSKKKLEIRGDVLLADPIYAYQIRDMKAPYGLSAELRRDPLKNTRTIEDYSIAGLALTLDPRVRETFLNFDNNSDDELSIDMGNVFEEQFLNFENEEVKSEKKEEKTEDLAAGVKKILSEMKEEIIENVKELKENKKEETEELSKEEIKEIKSLYNKIKESNTHVDYSTDNDIGRKEGNNRNTMETENKVEVKKETTVPNTESQVEAKEFTKSAEKVESTKVEKTESPAELKVNSESAKPEKVETVIKVDSSNLDNTVNKLADVLNQIQESAKPATPAFESKTTLNQSNDERVAERLMNDLNNMVPEYSK